MSFVFDVEGGDNLSISCRIFGICCVDVNDWFWELVCRRLYRFLFISRTDVNERWVDVDDDGYNSSDDEDVCSLENK